MDDVQIIELFFARDERAVKETDKKYGKLCFRVAKNFLLSSKDAEECVNDTYLVAWNKIPPTHPNNLMAFICKITRVLSLKRLEQLRAAKRSALEIVPLSELEDILPDSRIAPAVEDGEISKAISAFLRAEQEDARNVFLRRYWFSDSIRDIAERYSFTESKVKAMLFRSRNRLRKYLKKEGIEA